MCLGFRGEDPHGRSVLTAENAEIAEKTRREEHLGVERLVLLFPVVFLFSFLRVPLRDLRVLRG